MSPKSTETDKLSIIEEARLRLMEAEEAYAAAENYLTPAGREWGRKVAQAKEQRARYLERLTLKGN